MTTFLATGFEEALIGIGWQFTQQLAVYDYDKCLQILQRRMSLDDAIAQLESGCIGTWLGEGMPVFVHVGTGVDEIVSDDDGAED